MPFYPETETLPRTLSGVAPPNPTLPTLDETVAAAFRQDNTLVSLGSRLFEEQYPAEPDHNPLDIIRGTPFEQNYLDNFTGSRSEAETRSIMRRIDAEEQDRRALDAAGFPGVVAQIAAGVIDPTIALPAGQIVRGARGGYSALRSGALVGASAGAQVAAQEGLLQTTQETRTLAESATAIGSGTLLGAFIGGGAAAILTRAERATLEAALDATRAEIDLHAGNLPAPAGAAATDTRTLNLKKTGLEFTAPISPTRRVLSAQSIEARRTMADLAETPYRFEEAAQGIAATQGPALDRLARMQIEGTKVQVGDDLTRLYSEYRFGQPDVTMPAMRGRVARFMGNDTGKLTYDEFKREVSRALIEGDQHAVPQVAQAAQMIRSRVFEPWKQRAIEAGLLPEDVGVKTADSYFQRVYNKEAINANRPAFVDRVTEWLTGDQATKRQQKERLTTLNEQLNAARRKVERAKTEESTLAAQAEYDAVRARIEDEIAAWEGKSVAEAKAALKAREKYATAAERDAEAPRLRQADDAVDRAVKRIIESDRDLSPAELRSRAQEITDRILGTPDGRLPYDIDAGGPEIGWRGPGADQVRGPLQRREFNIPDAMIRDYLEQDVEQVVAMHLRTMVPDVLLTERFGDVRMTEPLKRITEDYAARIDAAKSEKARVALGKERDAVIRDIAAVRDRVRGVYGWSPDLRNMARVATAAKSINNITSMGVAAVSSLPDFAGAIFRHGLASVFADGWMPYLRYLTGAAPEFEKFKSQMRAIGIAIETTTNARQHAIDDVMDVYRPQSRFERGLQFVNDKFFVANLLAPLTDFQKTVAAHVSVSEIVRAAKAVAGGNASKRQIANLAEAGIDAKMADRIWRQFENGGEVTNGVHLPNTADWTDRAAADALNGAVAREVEIAVVTPGQEKPLWMSQPVLSLLGQFKSFTASATERILIANLQRRDAAVLAGLMFTIGLGMLSYKLNSFFGGSPTSDRPQDWVKEGISRSGLLGWFEEGNALASKMTRGGVDMYRMIGADKPLTRFASRSTLDMFLGPTAGKITSLSQITGAAASGEWTESDTRAVRRLTAFQNLFWLRGILNEVESGTNSMFGIPTKR